jgi:hypothetical protein
MTDANNIRDAADAIRGVVEAVPVYQDVVQPAAQEIGKALQTIAKTVHIAIAPISALVWGYEQIREFVLVRVAEKLKNVPPERIQTPSPNVAGPALEALRYTGHSEPLRELFANLLATSLDSETARNAHPAFVDIIKSITPDEAKIAGLFAYNRRFPTISIQALKKGDPFRPVPINPREYQPLPPTPKLDAYYDIFIHYSHIALEAKCEYPDLVVSYQDNLCRLGLTRYEDSAYLAAPNAYSALEQDPFVLHHIENVKEDSRHPDAIVKHGYIERTPFGKMFCDACVIDKNDSDVLPLDLNSTVP